MQGIVLVFFGHCLSNFIELLNVFLTDYDLYIALEQCGGATSNDTRTSG